MVRDFYTSLAAYPTKAPDSQLDTNEELIKSVQLNDNNTTNQKRKLSQATSAVSSEQQQQYRCKYSFLDIFRLVKSYSKFKNQSSLNLQHNRSLSAKLSSSSSSKQLIIPDNNDNNNGIENIAYTRFDERLNQNEDPRLACEPYVDMKCHTTVKSSPLQPCSNSNYNDIIDNSNVAKLSNNNHSATISCNKGQQYKYNNNNCRYNNTPAILRQSKSADLNAYKSGLRNYRQVFHNYGMDHNCNNKASSSSKSSNNNSQQCRSDQQIATSTVTPTPTPTLPQQSASSQLLPLVVVDNNKLKRPLHQHQATASTTSSVVARPSQIRNATFKIAKKIGSGGSLSSGCSHSSNSNSCSSSDHLEMISSSSSSPATMLTNQEEEDDEQYEIIDNVEMEKRERSLGFTIQNLNDQFYIKELVREPAISDGRIKPGDQILLVNGCDISTFTHSEAVDFLRSQPRVHLVLKRRKINITTINNKEHQQQTPKSNRIRKQLRQEALIYIRETAILRNSAGSATQPTKTRKGLGRSHNTTASSNEDNTSTSDQLVLNN